MVVIVKLSFSVWFQSLLGMRTEKVGGWVVFRAWVLTFFLNFEKHK